MKKILVLLLLISGLVKSQVVQPKSTTTFSNINAAGTATVAGKLRVGSSVAPTATLDVTGTMSVSSTATVGSLTTSGNITTTGSGSLTIAPNYNRLGNLYLQTTNASSLVTGATNGTIAVLSDAVFPIFLQGIQTNPADVTTYYFGNMPFGWNVNSTLARVICPYNATLVGYSANFVGTGGTSETSTLSININGTPTVLSSAITMSASINTFTATGLTTSISAGDMINAKIDCPTWVTNPTGMVAGITFWFVRRQ